MAKSHNSLKLFNFQQRFTAFLSFWKRQNFISFIGIFLLLLFFAKIIGVVAGLPFESENEPIIVQDTISEDLLLGIIILVFIVPVLETFFYQYLTIFIIGKFSTNKYLQVSFSAILFGLGHLSHSLSYAIFAVFVGIVLAIGLILYKEKTNAGKAFCVTALVHGIVNLIAVLFMVLFPTLL